MELKLMGVEVEVKGLSQFWLKAGAYETFASVNQTRRHVSAPRYFEVDRAPSGVEIFVCGYTIHFSAPQAHQEAT